MAIKQRLLKSIQHAKDLLETCDTAVLPKIVASLEDVDSLLQVGLTSNCRTQYKEIIDGVDSSLHHANTDELQEIFLLSKELLIFAEKQITEETHFKREIVFLPYKSEMWDSMESVWQAADEDKDHAIAYVVPIPYFDRNPDGSVKEWHCDAGKFPHYVPIRDYRSIDLEEMHPDVIVIHSPYDDTNIVTAVHPDYYSRNLKSYTDKLVYIPYFVHCTNVDPHDGVVLGSIAHLVLTPGVLNADLTIVQSENMRRAYIEILSQLSEHKDRAYWESRVLGLGSPKIDRIINICKKPPPPPQTWKKKIEGKRIFFYNTSLQTMLRDPNAFLHKLRYVFNCFRGRNDVCLIWRPHPLLESTFESMEKEYVEEYSRIVKEFRQSGIGIYDDSPDIGKTIALSDIYIGDAASSVTVLFGVTGKPIFIFDNRIIRQPCENDWRQLLQYCAYNINRCLIQGRFLSFSQSGGYTYHYFKRLVESSSSFIRYQMPVEIGDKIYVFPRDTNTILEVDRNGHLKDLDIGLTNGLGNMCIPMVNDTCIFILAERCPCLIRFDTSDYSLNEVVGTRDFFVSEDGAEKKLGGYCKLEKYIFLASPVDTTLQLFDKIKIA